MPNRVFQAFEYASYNIINEGLEGKKLPEDLYESLKLFAGEKDLPYYSLTARGVRFQNFVGALQIGRWTVEVLPKFDRSIPESSAQPILIQMLRQAGVMKIKTPTESSLRIKKNYILEAYIQMFLEEAKDIIYRGLIKKYHKKEENSDSLKGSINFPKHLSKNLIHAERFYIRHTIYDQQHELNQVLLKTLRVLLGMHAGYHLIAEIKMLLINLPELPDIYVNDEFFNTIHWTRKNEHYKNALEISRLLLLNYHPDLSLGKNNVLALMFDMNDLWEKWFAKRLKAISAQLNIPLSVKEQVKEKFWFPEVGYPIKQKPDIVIESSAGERIILDTKWKLITTRPGEDDIRQMFAYNQLFDSKVSFLVYPGARSMSISGKFFNPESNGSCGLAFIPFLEEEHLSSEGVKSFLTQLVNYS